MKQTPTIQEYRPLSPSSPISTAPLLEKTQNAVNISISESKQTIPDQATEQATDKPIHQSNETVGNEVVFENDELELGCSVLSQKSL